jgi:hypothetical protein
MTTAEYMPALGANADANGALLRQLLASTVPGRLVLPAGDYPLSGGLVVNDGWTLRGADTTLRRVDATADPVIHVQGSGVTISDLTIELPDAEPGPHDGARWTAVTIGDYFYAAAPRWIHDIVVERLLLRRPGRCTANMVTLIGAARDVRLSDLEVEGGGTAFVAHWGAVGTGVEEITGCSLHPHHFLVERLLVRNAFEAFCLSSVHDAAVRDVSCDGVEIGWRLLPGDNTDRYRELGQGSGINERIVIDGCDIGWCGDLYAIRVAGWGRSEVDGQVTVRGYSELDVRDVVIRPQPVCVAGRRPRAGRRPVVVEKAGTVDLGSVKVLPEAKDAP